MAIVFFPWASIQSFGTHLQKNSLTFVKLNEKRYWIRSSANSLLKAFLEAILWILPYIHPHQQIRPWGVRSPDKHVLGAVWCLLFRAKTALETKILSLISRLIFVISTLNFACKSLLPSSLNWEKMMAIGYSHFSLQEHLKWCFCSRRCLCCLSALKTFRGDTESCTEITPKSPFLCVNGSPLRYGFCVSAKANRNGGSPVSFSGTGISLSSGFGNLKQNLARFEIESMRES